MRNWILLFLPLAVLITNPVAAQETIQPIDAPHLHNVWRLSPRIISGSEPEDEAAFAELSKLGVKTIVSVDGIDPRADWATKHGMRYVHIPIGYDGIDEQARGSLTRVANEINGLIYIHCHHGKHRGPAAAAVLCRADDGRSADAARVILEKAGTGKEYPGLWRDVAQFVKPTGPLPALSQRAAVESLAAAMARIDRAVDHLKLFSQSKWQPLSDHPDLVAKHDAVQLMELFKESARVTKPGPLRDSLQQSATAATELQAAVAGGDNAAADKLLGEISKRCTACHKEHRN